MVEISIKSDVEKALARFKNVNQAELAKAAAMAINQAIAAGRTVAVREIKKKYNIDPKFLKDKIGVKDNRYNALKIFRANANNLTATLRAYGKPIPLIAFPVTETDTGIEVSVMKGSTKPIKSAFIAQMRSGHRSVFARGKYGNNAFNQRMKRIKPFPLPDTPITQLTTTSIRTAIVSPDILSALKVRVEKDFETRLVNKIRYQLSKR